MSREIKSELVITDVVRLNNNESGLVARNAANTADISIAHVDIDDELIIGDAAATGFVITSGGMNVVVGGGTGTIDQLADELFLQGGSHNAYLSFYDLTSTNKMTLTGFAGLTADTLWVLPNGNGSAGQVLGTDGANPANLSWVDQTGGGGGSAGFSGPFALTNSEGTPTDVTGFVLDHTVSKTYEIAVFTYYFTTGTGATEGGSTGIWTFNYLEQADTWQVTLGEGYGSGDTLALSVVPGTGQVQYTTGDVTSGGTTGTAVGEYNLFWEIVAPGSGSGTGGNKLTTFAMTNNQAAPADIAGLVLDHTTSQIYFLNIGTYGLTTGTGAQEISSSGVYSAIWLPGAMTWLVEEATMQGSSDPGFALTVTGAGQVQYTTGDITNGGTTGTAVSAYDLFWAFGTGSSVGTASGVSIAAPSYTTAGGNVDEQIPFTNANINFDTGNYAATANELTVPSTTQYWLSAAAQAPSPSGAIKVGYSVNAGPVTYLDQASPNGDLTLDFTILLDLTAGDAVKVWTNTQNSTVLNPIVISLARQGGGSGSGGGGMPAGSDGNIQFNSSGVFGADSALSWDNTSKSLVLGATSGAHSAPLETWSAGGDTFFAAVGTTSMDGAIIFKGTPGSGFMYLQGTDGSKDAALPLVLQFEAGNVGIGTGTPGEKLEVTGAVRVTSTAGTNVASAADFDWDGAARIISRGADPGTAGDIQFNVVSSDGSIDNTAMTITGTGLVGIGVSPSWMLDIASTTFGANNPTLHINVTGAGGGEVDAIILNSDGNTGMRMQNTGAGTNGTYVGFDAGATADFQINNGDSGKISFYTGGIGALVINADTSISIHSDQMEINPAYTSNTAGLGTFWGNISDNDQTTHQIFMGSSDTAVDANLTSSLFIFTGSNTNAASTANTGGITISPGEVVNGSGNPGSLQLYGGSVGIGSANGGALIVQGGFADSGTGGVLALNGGNSNSGPGGNITLTSGTGSARGMIQFLDGSEGTAGYVWTSIDGGGTGTWMPGASSTWQSVDWHSNDSQGNTLVAAQPAIYADSTLSAYYNIIATDVQAGDTTSYGGSLQMFAGSILEPTSTNNAGSIQIGGGYIFGGGTGSPGYVTLNGGNTDGSAQGGNVQFTSGNSTSGLGGNLILLTGTGTTQGLIQFQDGTQGTAGYTWNSIDAAGSGHWTPGNTRITRILNSGSNTIAVTDFKLLCDTTDASASTVLLPAGTDQLTFRLSGTGGGAFSYTITPNGGDLIDVSAPTVISAGSIVEYTFLGGTWYAS